MNHDPIYKALETINFRLADIGGRSLTLGTVIVALLTVIAAYGVSWLAQRGVARALDTKDQGSVHVVSRLLHYVIIGVGFSIALETAGVELRALFAAGAVFAVGIGFAMQNIVQNFVSGVILLVEHSIRPGDVLDIEGRQVRVIEMGVRSTRVRSRDDEILIVPNSTLVQSTVRSYTLMDTLCRVRVTVGVTYDSDMTVVRATLEEAARTFTARSQTKAPLVMLINFSPSSVDWEVSIWIEDPWQLRPSGSLLREAVWNAFAAREIRMAYPQLDVHFDEPVVTALAERGPRAA